MWQMIKSLKSSGFTILELMITIAVVGVLAAVALPSFNYTIQNNRVKTAASDAHMSLLLARSEAIKRNNNVRVKFNSNGWSVAYWDPDASTPDYVTLTDKTDLSSDVNYDPYLGGTEQSLPQDIVFNRSGRLDPSTNSVSIELRFTSSKLNTIPLRCVSLSLSGRPKVETDSDGDATNGCG